MRNELLFIGIFVCLFLGACDKVQQASPPPAIIIPPAAPPPTNTANNNKTFLDDISGVWRASDGGLFSIVYKDRKFQLLVGDDSLATTVGDIDEVNQTVNLNVTLANGKPGIWTLRRIWDDKENSSFHLMITLHDGTQDELSFVRKISTDDLNKIAVAETNIRAGNVSETAAAAAKAGGNATAQTSSYLSVDSITSPPSTSSDVAVAKFSPSFDCLKVSTGPERLICSNKELAEADVRMVQVYKSALANAPDERAFKAAQGGWRKNVRDACSDMPCMLNAYNTRIAELSR